MTLTVPRAGTSGGAAARVRVETPQVGAAVAEFGQVMKQIGDRTLADTLQREALRFQTDLTADMNSLRLEVSQIADPDQAETTWMERSQELRTTYLEGQREDGRPHVSPANVERFGLVFDELNNRNAFSVGKQVLGQRHAEREATYIRHVQVAGQAAAMGDANARQTQIDLLIDHVDQLETSGVIDAAEAERRRIAAVSELDNVRAMRLMSDDPQGLISELDGGGLSFLPSDVAEDYRADATARVQRQAALDRQSELVAQEERAREVASELEKIASAAFDANAVIDRSWLRQQQGQPGWDRAVEALRLAGELPDLRGRPPAEIQMMALMSQDGSGGQNLKSEILAAEVARSREGFRADPVGYAQAVGMDVPELPAFEDLGPEVFVAALERRAAFAHDLHEAGYTPLGMHLMTIAERGALDNHLQDAQARKAIGTEVAKRFGDEAPAVLSSLGVNPFPYDPNRARALDVRIAEDPDVARLARATRFVPISAEAVARMDALIADLDRKEPEGRAEFVSAEVEAAGRAVRVGLEKPLYFGGGEVTPESLKEAAGRIVRARRSGALNEMTYRDQARLIRRYMESFDG